MKKILLILMVLFVVSGCSKTYTIAGNKLTAKDVKCIEVYDSPVLGWKVEEKQQIENIISKIAVVNLVEMEKPDKQLYGGYSLVIKMDTKDISIGINGVFMSIDDHYYECDQKMADEIYSLFK